MTIHTDRMITALDLVQFAHAAVGVVVFLVVLVGLGRQIWANQNQPPLGDSDSSRLKKRVIRAIIILAIVFILPQVILFPLLRAGTP